MKKRTLLWSTVNLHPHRPILVNLVQQFSHSAVQDLGTFMKLGIISVTKIRLTGVPCELMAY